MNGYHSINEFERLLDHQRRAIARMTGAYFPYTIFGCNLAKQMLRRQGVYINPRFTGWEIVHMANKELMSDRRRLTV